MIVEVNDLHWPFGGGGSPHLHLPGPDNERSTNEHNIDPFPCYAHDLAVVEETMDKVYAVAGNFKLAPHSIYVLGYESKGRTNGWAVEGYAYRDAEGNRQMHRGYVVLAGKRIPPHPAMTRYLVAHEIGHHADYDICLRRGLESYRGGFDDEYAKLRGLTHDYKRYGGGAWHSNVGEMIANDFRIAVCGVETDFWPHPGFDHPNDVPGLDEWWAKNWWEPLTSGT